ncbi:MAG TPA: GGDEF domain-containing protein [Noviherbaspirillum sp.]|jgi:diguanylate cyclase (GGDEF)-like protein|uniref:GGDEF domain-containing protein n=1 Tax=Noviherbaspirillum sp. TaxID=1926288 RepID=UPI002F937788
MFSTKEILLISALLCFVMFLVMYAFRGNGIRGTSELLLANVLGMCTFVLYAFGRELPDWIAYEGANAFYAAAGAAAFVGYRRLMGRGVSLAAVAVTVVLMTASIWFFRHVWDSFAWRSVAVSLYQAGLAAGVALAVATAHPRYRPSTYTLGFILSMCAAIGVGHAYRGALFIFGGSVPGSLLEPSGWNHLFLAAGAFSLPVLTLGGLLVAHREIVTLAEHAANRDFLTGAWSRRAFFEVGEREVARSARNGRPMSVLLLDLDRLKELNDTHGHAAGDQALCVFVDTVSRGIRDIDCFARLGGDEFAVALPETDLAGAILVAQRLRADINDRMKVPGWPNVTASIGIALLRPSETLNSLLHRADRSLYEAKAAGRNQFVVENIVVPFRPHSASA